MINSDPNGQSQEKYVFFQSCFCVSGFFWSKIEKSNKNPKIGAQDPTHPKDPKDFEDPPDAQDAQNVLDVKAAGDP